MDVELARTFLAILETGKFGLAAKRLNVTQSTISMRIRELESRLGRPLFVRNRAGAVPTAAGLQFSRHAETLVRVWRQAQQETGLASHFRAVLAVGGQVSLWDRVLLQWIRWMRREMPDIALRAEIGQSDELMRHVLDGLIDLGVMYTPQSRPGLKVAKVFEENLILVATTPEHPGVGAADYVYVDWGHEFDLSHRVAYPESDTPGLFVRLGILGLRYLLDVGGAGYFPARVVRPLIAEGRLYPVSGAPEFSRPAYVVYRPREGDEIVTTALVGLHQAAAQAGDEAS